MNCWTCWSVVISVVKPDYSSGRNYLAILRVIVMLLPIKFSILVGFLLPLVGYLVVKVIDI